MESFRERCADGKMTVGTFCAIPHPVAIEVTAAAGVDFICIDWEHAQISRERIEDLVRAADVHRVPAIIRVPGHAPESIATALDAGAAGVLVPRVSTAEQARVADYASPELGEARRNLTAARDAVRDEEMVIAERYAIQARADAELAIAKAGAAKAREVNEELQASIDALRQEAQRNNGDRP